jgi:hypothetical protein
MHPSTILRYTFLYIVLATMPYWIPYVLGNSAVTALPHWIPYVLDDPPINKRDWSRIAAEECMDGYTCIDSVCQ